MVGITRRSIVRAAPAALATIAVGRGVCAAWPDRLVETIVPSRAGGGMDTTARALATLINQHRLLGQELTVVNVDGGEGTVGTREVKDAPPDGYTIGYWHEALVTAAAAGQADFDHHAFEMLGSTGYQTLGIGVARDGPIGSLEELVALGRKEPGTIKCATNAHLPVHFYSVIFESIVGADYRYVQAGGGAKRLPSVLDGQTDFAMFDTLEFLKFAEAGLVPLVLFATHRSPLLPDLPTGKEKGIDLLALISRIWLAPKGTPAPVIARLSGALRAAMDDADLVKSFEDDGLVAEFVEPAIVSERLDLLENRARLLLPQARDIQQG